MTITKLQLQQFLRRITIWSENYRLLRRTLFRGGEVAQLLGVEIEIGWSDIEGPNAFQNLRRECVGNFKQTDFLEDDARTVFEHHPLAA